MMAIRGGIDDHHSLISLYKILFILSHHCWMWSDKNICHCFVLNIFDSQLHLNGIEQQAMPIQALSFLHLQAIHSVISVWVCTNYINNIR
jgi:hypothetical protein